MKGDFFRGNFFFKSYFTLTFFYSLQKLEQEHNFMLSQTSEIFEKRNGIIDRKKYLENEITNTTSLISTYSNKISTLTDKTKKSNELINNIKLKIENLKTQVDSTKSKMNELDLERSEKREELSKLNEQCRYLSLSFFFNVHTHHINLLYLIPSHSL